MGFEVLDKRAAGVSKHPYITIQRKGPLSFNRIAYELLGNPEAGSYSTTASESR